MLRGICLSKRLFLTGYVFIMGQAAGNYSPVRSWAGMPSSSSTARVSVQVVVRL